MKGIYFPKGYQKPLEKDPFFLSSVQRESAVTAESRKGVIMDH